MQTTEVPDLTGATSSSGISLALSSADVPRVDLLSVIHRSRVLLELEFEKLRRRVQSGEYPADPVALADRLVRENVLTDYQARRFLKGKSHGLAVGRYAVLDHVGSGAMGHVYRARHLLMDRVVALKVIAPELLANKKKVARFRREMQLVGRLDHPNVVRALDADQIGNVLFIVMEYVSGRCLASRLEEKGPLPPHEVIDYAAQAALGLAHAHEKGVIHRDVKPSNLLITRERRLKILDFGLGVLDSFENDPAKTTDGIAVGTVDFMSPEQALGRELDGRSDLYSLGCVIYRLLTGEDLFQGNSVVERLSRRTDGRPINLRGRHPNIPEGLRPVLEKLLAPKPENRFQNGEEAARALEGLLRHEVLPGPNGSSSVDVALPRVAACQTPSSTELAPAATASPSNVELPHAPPVELMPQWLRFLMFLAEQPPLRVLVILGLALLGAFGAGFALASALR